MSFTVKGRHFGSGKYHPRAYDEALLGGLHDFSGNDSQPINAHDTLNLGHEALNKAEVPIGRAENGRQRLMIGKLIGLRCKKYFQKTSIY